MQEDFAAANNGKSSTYTRAYLTKEGANRLHARLQVHTRDVQSIKSRRVCNKNRKRKQYVTRGSEN
jgi:hypothetical protein